MSSPFWSRVVVEEEEGREGSWVEVSMVGWAGRWLDGKASTLVSLTGARKLGVVREP